MTRDTYYKKLEAIRKSRKGCTCTGRLKCTTKWIRCNEVLKHQAAAREKLGPPPK